MNKWIMKFLPVAIHAFFAWAVVLFVLTLTIDLPRGAFITLHYVADVLVFATVFHFFYETHKHAAPYTTAILTLVSLFMYEAIFLGFFSSDPGRFLNYVDWIFPAFLIATTIYAVGKRT